MFILNPFLYRLMTAPVAAAATTQEKTKRRSWGKVLEWGGLKSSSS